MVTPGSAADARCDMLMQHTHKFPVSGRARGYGSRPCLLPGGVRYNTVRPTPSVCVFTVHIGITNLGVSGLPPSRAVMRRNANDMGVQMAREHPVILAGGRQVASGLALRD